MRRRRGTGGRRKESGRKSEMIGTGESEGERRRREKKRRGRMGTLEGEAKRSEGGRKKKEEDKLKERSIRGRKVGGGG